MNKIRTLFMLFALLVLSANAFAASSVSIPNTNAEAGASVVIPINANFDFQLTAFQFTITYNPAVLNCTGAALGDLFNGIGGWSVSSNPVTGQIGLLGNDANANGIAPGSGNIAKLNCTAVGNSGQSTPLQFAGVNVLVDTDINEYVPTATQGTFTIGGQCVPSTEVCDGADNDCDGQVDEGITPVPTTCGIGACAATGQSTCQGGQMVDNCTPGQAGTEGPAGNATCSDQTDNDCDGSTDSADSSCQGTQSGMGQWVGTWFSVKRTLKGKTFSTPDSTFLVDKDGGNGYIHIWSWDPDTKELHYDYYEYMRNEGKWESYTDKLHFFAGTDLKFLFSYYNTDVNLVSAFSGVIEGKVQKGIFKSATMKSLGGYYTEVYNDNTLYSTGLQTVTGKMINESKVPVPAEVIIQH